MEPCEGGKDDTHNLPASSGCTRVMPSSIDASCSVKSKISRERVSLETTRRVGSYWHHPSRAESRTNCRRSLLACRACSACLRSVMSRAIFDAPVMLPSAKAWPANVRARTEVTATASLDGPRARCPAQRAGRDEGTASRHEQRSAFHLPRRDQDQLAAKPRPGAPGGAYCVFAGPRLMPVRPALSCIG